MLAMTSDALSVMLPKAPIKGIPSSRLLPQGCKTAADVPWPVDVPLPAFDEFCIGYLTKKGHKMENHARGKDVTVQHCLLGWVDACFKVPSAEIRNFAKRDSCVQHMREAARKAVLIAIKRSGSFRTSIASFNDQGYGPHTKAKGLTTHKRKLAAVWKRGMAVLGYTNVEDDL